MVFVYLALTIAAGMTLDRLVGYALGIGFQYYIYKREAPQRAKAQAEIDKLYASLALGAGRSEEDIPGGNSPLSVN